MQKHWRQTLLAIFLSAAVAAGNYYWYQSTLTRFTNDTDETPVAYVSNTFDEILRRPASSLLWVNIEKGEALYNGEAIRTSEHGSVRIVFSGTERFLDIEPESLIFLRKVEGDISLDLMEGSLFVKNDSGANAATGAGPGLVLNSENGKIDLSKASASLSKSGSSGLNVEVLEGKASIQGKDGKSKELTSGAKTSLGALSDFNINDVKIESPLLRKPFYMNPNSPEPVVFKWNGFPSNTQVNLWIGQTKRNMKLIPSGDSPQQISQTLGMGTHFWKLVATDKETGTKKLGETSIYKLDIIARYPPLVKSPTPDQVIVAPQLPQIVKFEWENMADTASVTLEIAKDPEFKAKLISKQVIEQTYITYSMPTEGKFYYRLTARYKDSNKAYTTSLLPFKISTDEIYTVPVVWTMNDTDLVQYFIDNPSLSLRWTSRDKDKVTQWRVTYKEKDSKETDQKPVVLEAQNLQSPIDRPGRYIASVEALDQKGRVMGTSEPINIDVRPLPLIGIPQLESTEGKIKANTHGETEIKWTSVTGAQDYVLTIKSGSKELKKTKYKTNSVALKNLMPGEYQVEVMAIDQHGRNGEGVDTKTLVVPDKSGIRAPKLKGIKVN